MGRNESHVIVLSAPSAAGKTTIANHLVDDLPIRFATSATTRSPRENEEHGDDYYFHSQASFQELIDEDELLEYEEVHDNTYYGTLRHEVETSDKPILLDIDVKGGMNVKQTYEENALLLFIAPPSLNILKQRLERRNTHSQQEIQQRLARAQTEMTYQEQYDHVIINDDLDEAVATTKQHIQDWLPSSFNV